MEWKGFVEGGVASMVAGVITHPLDLIKVRMQLPGVGVAASTTSSSSYAINKQLNMPIPYRPSTYSVAINIARSEGVKALYHGVSATLLRQLLYSSTRMGLYNHLKDKWKDPAMEGSGLSLSKKVAASFLAGAFGAVIGNPADVAMVRMQADGRLPANERRNYTSVGNALLQMAKREGATSLWMGSASAVTRAMLVATAQLATYDQIKDSILAHQLLPDGVTSQVVASIGAGVLASMVSNPINVVRTRVMTMNRGVKDGVEFPLPYQGALDCAVKVVRSEGPMALYKGFVPTVTRQGPYVIILFLSFEQMKQLIEGRH